MDPFYSNQRVIRLRGAFHSEETPTGLKGTNFLLKERGYGILILERNGVPETGFTFIKPRNITLSSPISQNDEFFVVYDTKIPDEMIIESLENATEVIDSFLADVYTQARVDQWKQYTLNHGVVAGGPFVVDDIITAANSGAIGKVITVSSTSLVILPLNGLLFEEADPLTGSISGATATTTVNTVDGIQGVVATAPGLVIKIATVLAITYAWELFWDKNHTVNPELRKALYQKAKAYYEKLHHIQIGKINLPGETRSGSRSKPSIGRATPRVFRKQLDLEDTDYTDFTRVDVFKHLRGGSV